MSLQINKLLKEKLLIFDGAMGTELYSRHIFTNRSYDEVCLSLPQLVKSIHNDYIKAGADVITTNSFGANAVNLKAFGLSEKAEAIAEAAAKLARACADDCQGRKIYVAGSLGPISSLVASVESRIAALTAQAQALISGGADFLLFETLPNRESAQIACRVMQNIGNEFPFVLSHSTTMDAPTDALLRERFALFEGLPTPQALGLNCGNGPAEMLGFLEMVMKFTELPVIVQPNAGTPKMLDGRQIYLCNPEYLFTYAMRYVTLGARGIGGCCGTTPDHIAELARAIKPLSNAFSSISVKAPAEPTTLPRQETPLEQRSHLGEKLATHQWITTIEVTPPTSWDTSKIIEKAKQCKEHGIDCVNIPDGPRACPRISALVTAMQIQEKAGIEAVLHICGRDRNMLALQADMLGAASCGLHNFLMITGDPPKLGNYSFASGVFDTDSIGLVRLQKYLNQGTDLGGQPITPATSAVIGVGADPNAIDFDREVRRLREKVEAGAHYITTQPVFDPSALFRFMDAIADLNIPLIAGIWPLTSLRNAQFMRAEVPGVVVPDEVMRRMSEPATGEEQLKVGIQIAQESIAAIQSRVSGIQVSAPFGKVNIAFEVMGK